MGKEKQGFWSRVFGSGGKSSKNRRGSVAASRPPAGPDSEHAAKQRAAARRASITETEGLVAQLASAGSGSGSLSNSKIGEGKSFERKWGSRESNEGQVEGGDDGALKSDVERSVDRLVGNWRAGGSEESSTSQTGDGDRLPPARLSASFSQLFSRRPRAKLSTDKKMATGTTRRVNPGVSGRSTRTQQTRREAATSAALLKHDVFTMAPAERTEEDVEEARSRLLRLHNDFLQRCGAKVVGKLAHTIALESFRAGDVIFRQGDTPAEKFYIIVVGRVRLSVHQITKGKERSKQTTGSADGTAAVTGGKGLSRATEEALMMREARAGVAKFTGGRRASQVDATMQAVSRQLAAGKDGPSRSAWGAPSDSRVGPAQLPTNAPGEKGAGRKFGTKEHTIAELADADSFGELGLLNDAPRSATVTCLTDASMLVVRREDFDRYMKESEEEHLLRKVKTLRSLKQFANVSDRHAREIAQFFAEHEFVEGDVFDLDTSDRVHFIIEGEANLAVPLVGEGDKREKRKVRRGQGKLMKLQAISRGANFGETCMCPAHRRGWVMQATSPVLRTYAINRVQMVDHVDKGVIEAIEEELAFRTSYFDSFYDGALDRMEQLKGSQPELVEVLKEREKVYTGHRRASIEAQANVRHLKERESRQSASGDVPMRRARRLSVSDCRAANEQARVGMGGVPGAVAADSKDAANVHAQIPGRRGRRGSTVDSSEGERRRSRRSSIHAVDDPRISRDRRGSIDAIGAPMDNGRRGSVLGQLNFGCEIEGDDAPLRFPLARRGSTIAL